MTYQLTTSKGSITIRPALRDDAGLLRALRIEALAAQPEAFAADYTAAQEDPVDWWVGLITDYALDNKGVISLACHADQLIGMTGLIHGHWPKTRHSGNIWGVYVNPDWRGLHVGESLIKECLAWAQAQGLTIVKLGVVTTNTAAIRCYARCGFTVFGIEPQAICYDGVDYDELLMAKSINAR
jgi:RimJ/RimL family protein N-acetyltransferase